MKTSTLVGVLAIPILAMGWVAVQRAWHRSFFDVCSDPDALAGRGDCDAHDCAESCARHPDGDANPEESP